jgi:outer membrane protein OmpA-like peptidoglycan-associated protein
MAVWLLGVMPALAQEAVAGADTNAYLVSRLSINSNRGDFGPYLLQKKLYFTSGRVHRYGLVYYNEDTTRELEDVFYAEQLDSVNFRPPHYFSEKVNTKFNDGPLCFNRSGDVLYITGNDLKRINHHIEPLDIFVSHKVHGHWEAPQALPFCTGHSSYCHPALRRDQKTLIFASDMPGGFGGMDLYAATFENGSWSAPQNLGPLINTASNEIFPFVSEADVLYFSSNRGGNLDIFMVELGASSPAPAWAGWPLNSEKDDFGVWIDSSGMSGYFSSDRGGNDDIYYFKNKYPRFENCVEQQRPKYCYTFFEESTLQTEDTLGMIYEWDLGDGTKKRGISVRHCYEGPGNYSVQLNIVDKASGALFFNELSYDFAVDPAKLLYIEGADTVMPGKTVLFSSKSSEIPGRRIGDRYWFFGNGQYAAGAEAGHRFDKEGAYLVTLGVLTRDSLGRVEKFCTQKKVLVRDSAWIAARKSSFTHTVWPPPHKADTTFRAKEGGDVNFRVHLGTSKENIPVDSKLFNELGDVKKTRDKEVYHYTSGAVKKLKDAAPYYKKAREKGFKHAAVVSYYRDSLMPNQERSMKGVIRNGEISAADPDTILWSLNVFFDVNSAEIDGAYYRALDSLSNKLKANPRLELIVLSVTDTTGSEQYNYKLAKKRALNVQGYLRKRGIADKRLDVISLGENLPAEYYSRKNVLLSNRRVELMVVKSEK